MNKYIERLYNGIIKENPTLILMLGMCPTLAVTTSSINGLGMGINNNSCLDGFQLCYFITKKDHS